MTACSEITQSPDGNRASGRRPRSMTTSTSSLTSGCRASPRLILAGTTSKNASSSSLAPAAATGITGAGAAAPTLPRHGVHARSRTAGARAAAAPPCAAASGPLRRARPPTTLRGDAACRAEPERRRRRVERPEHRSTTPNYKLPRAKSVNVSGGKRGGAR